MAAHCPYCEYLKQSKKKEPPSHLFTGLILGLFFWMVVLAGLFNYHLKEHKKELIHSYKRGAVEMVCYIGSDKCGDISKFENLKMIEAIANSRR